MVYFGVQTGETPSGLHTTHLPTCGQGIDTLAGGPRFICPGLNWKTCDPLAMYLLQVVSQESLPQLSSSQGRAEDFLTAPVGRVRKTFFRANFSLVWIPIPFGAHRLQKKLLTEGLKFFLCGILAPRRMGILTRLKLGPRKVFLTRPTHR